MDLAETLILFSLPSDFQWHFSLKLSKHFWKLFITMVCFSILFFLFSVKIILIKWYQTNEVSKQRFCYNVCFAQRKLKCRKTVTFPRSYGGQELEFEPSCTWSQLCCCCLSKLMNKIWETKFNFFLLTL